MEQKSAYLELTIISAEDLKRKWLSGDQTVAVAWVDPSTKETTSIVSGNGSNVQWHEKLILNLNGVDTMLQGKLLTIEVYAQGMCGKSLLGSVYVPLSELVSDGESGTHTILMYQIVQPSGKREGSMKFFARVVKPKVSGCIVPMSGSVVPLPSAPPILLPEEDLNSLGSDALYPPASSVFPVAANEGRPSSKPNVTYPTLQMLPYPPHLSQNHAARHDAWQHSSPSYGIGFYPPNVYPPGNTDYPLHTSPHPSYSNGADVISCPPQWPPVLEKPYPPPAFMYPPYKLSSEAPYPHQASHPNCLPIASHTSEMYSMASVHPYSAFSSPLYPPPYSQQQPTVHYS